MREALFALSTAKATSSRPHFSLPQPPPPHPHRRAPDARVPGTRLPLARAAPRAASARNSGVPSSSSRLRICQPSVGHETCHRWASRPTCLSAACAQCSAVELRGGHRQDAGVLRHDIEEAPVEIGVADPRSLREETIARLGQSYPRLGGVAVCEQGFGVDEPREPAAEAKRLMRFRRSRSVHRGRHGDHAMTAGVRRRPLIEGDRLAGVSLVDPERLPRHRARGCSPSRSRRTRRSPWSWER